MMIARRHVGGTLHVNKRRVKCGNLIIMLRKIAAHVFCLVYNSTHNSLQVYTLVYHITLL